VWKAQFVQKRAANYGIGGDSTRQVLYRIENGLIEEISPRVVVLMIGTNNLYGDFNAGTDEEIAAGIEAVVSAVRGKLPDAKIVLLGLLPRQNDYFGKRVATINTRIGRLDDGAAVRFLDMSAEFQHALGKVKPELYDKDQLHLAGPGYEAWARLMQPLFDALLGGAQSE